MLSEMDHARIRRIRALGIKTPLVVPSFSSRGFPDIGTIYDEIKYRLFGVCLISAWDIANGYIGADTIVDTDVVVLDSGGYETDLTHQVCTVNANWSESEHRSILADLDDEANVIVVSFDRHGLLQSQIEGATADFERAPATASDFLIKPTAIDEIVNIPALAKVVSDLKEFDVIGITAREVANSFVGRCRAIVTLRDLLGDAGLEIPIHVFGAITPYEILAYYFSGADVFDGLNWLRLAYRKDRLVTLEEAAFEFMNWNQHDSDLWIAEWTNNLMYLYELQEAMRGFSETGDMSSLLVSFPMAHRAARIAQIAGAHVQNGAQMQREVITNGR